MPEYRIVTKIDPAPAVQGAAKVKQELGGIEAAAQSAGQATERMTAAQFRSAQKAGAEFQNLGKAIGVAARAQKEAENAAQRVEAVVDQEAAALRRMNALLKDAGLAHRAGALSAENYARMQKLAADGAATMTNNLGRTRAGFTQLSFQLGDISQGLAMGTRASTIFAQQSGQVVQALQIMGGQGNAFLKFIGGPWGIAISTAAVVLLPLISNLFSVGDAVQQATDKLKEDARQSEIDREAKERFQHSEEGVEKAIRDATAARKDEIEKSRTSAENSNISAQANLREEMSWRNKTKALLDHTRAELAEQMRLAGLPGRSSEVAASRLSGLQAELDAQTKRADQENQRIAEAQRELQASRGDLAVEQANKRAAGMISPEGRIASQYDAQKKALEEQYKLKIASAGSTANENALTQEQIRLANELTGKLTAIGKERDRQLKALRATAQVYDTFRSREQAIGIAGRELQGAGLKVSENVQFGGVRGDHPGMGNAAHGKYAIDVNAGTGITEANVPDLRARFDQLARLYQSRGYRVLWAGKVWEAGQNGPTRPIPTGQPQHYDHMHLEAPGTIVGKATQSSTAQQELREAGQAATVAEQKRDFVQSIVDRATGKGLPDNRATALQSDIGSALADYQRRFNAEPTPAEREKIVGALTDAEARSQAEHFRVAYVQPLEDLQAGLGRVGLAREIYNKQLEETTRKGAPLTAVEKAQIENSARMTDQLEREQRVLEEINKPIEDYRQQLAALVALLQQGQISQGQFNARVADLQGPARQALGNMPAEQIDPNTGLSYGQISQTADENARYAQQLADLETHRQALLDLGINYDALEAAAHLEHINKLNEMDQARRSVQLTAAQSISDSLLSIAENSVGKQSSAYRALFAISKAFTIAQASLALYQNVAKAMSIGFPQNLPFIAAAFAQGATIVAAINSVSNPGFMRGGYTGDGRPNEPAGTVHGREFVVNAAATARNRPLLEAINIGSLSARSRSIANDNAGGGSAFGGLTVKVSNYAPGVGFEVERGATPDEVVIIARRVARDESPRAVAADMANPNSRTSRAVEHHFNTSRKRR